MKLGDRPDSDFAGIPRCHFHSWKLVAKHTEAEARHGNVIPRRILRCETCGVWTEIPVSREHEQTNSKYPRVRPGPMPDQASIIDGD
jgi:hypothetical protein